MRGLMDCGVDGYDSLPPKVDRKSNPAAKKRALGNEMFFYGGIDVQETLPWGKPDDVRAEVRARIWEMGHGGGYLLSSSHRLEHDVPVENTLAMIDEAHEFLPREGKTAASDALIQLLREGRQPGISMVLATQQPGEIHKDVMTQSDIVISHRVTARKDIVALNDIMQTYLLADIQKYLNNLPRLNGSAIILDDNSERIYPMKVRPRFTWHGGEAPSAYYPKRKELLDLGL